ncbi:MAG TPA: histidine phosphatase family protein [Thermoleophilaceae bacterium]|nr:histidine phosphatase family protein [Thermoleophilaceae bacterium]
MLRHADAEDGSPDAERPLSDKGRGQADAAGRALAAMGVELDACVTSPKVRARDTAVLACKALGVEPEEDRRLEGGPFDPREVAEGRGEEVLLVGHDPDFSLAVNHLTGAQVRMKKGGLAAVDRGELMVLLRPRELALLAQVG